MNMPSWVGILWGVLKDSSNPLTERLATIPYMVPPYGLRWLARRSWVFRHYWYLLVDIPWRLNCWYQGYEWEGWPCYWDYWDAVLPGGMDSAENEVWYEDIYWLYVTGRDALDE